MPTQNRQRGSTNDGFQSLIADETKKTSYHDIDATEIQRDTVASASLVLYEAVAAKSAIIGGLVDSYDALTTLQKIPHIKQIAKVMPYVSAGITFIGHFKDNPEHRPLLRIFNSAERTVTDIVSDMSVGAVNFPLLLTAKGSETFLPVMHNVSTAFYNDTSLCLQASNGCGWMTQYQEHLTAGDMAGVYLFSSALAYPGEVLVGVKDTLFNAVNYFGPKQSLSSAELFSGQLQGGGFALPFSTASYVDFCPESFLYRGSSRLPEYVFNNGFKAKGNNTCLYQHVVLHCQDTGYIATSTCKNVAFSFKNKVAGGFVYEILPHKNAIDVPSFLMANYSRGPDIHNALQFVAEKEMSVPHQIKPWHIKGAW